MDISSVRILAIVVTYFPEKNLLNRNISAFINYVDRVLIWENTPLDKSSDYRFVFHEKIVYCGDGVNSISHALNYAWHYAKDNGFGYLLTMDQDSLWGENFTKYLDVTIGNPNAPRGIFGPIVNRTIEIDYEEMPSIITSGMLASINLIDIVDGWNESFPIESVDAEFCLHAHRMGVKTYRVGNCCLTQRYGNPLKKSFWGHVVELRNDSPDRLYNIFRNHIIVIRKYPEQKSFRHFFYINWVKRIKWILVFENCRIKKAKAIFKGIVAGFVFDVSNIR